MALKSLRRQNDRELQADRGLLKPALIIGL